MNRAIQLIANIGGYAISEIVDVMAIVGGALVGMHFAQPDSKREGFMYFLTALCCAYFLGGWAIEYYALKPKAAGAVSFVSAIGGVYVVRGLVVFFMLFAKDPFGAIGRLKNVFKQDKTDGNDSQ